MSYLSDNILVLLKEVFPYTKIKEEYYVEYKGQRLFVDFFLPSFSIAVEVHGRQHDEFVEHFHVDSLGWKKHKKRDRIKEAWAEQSNITYVVIRESDKIKTKEDLLNIISRS